MIQLWEYTIEKNLRTWIDTAYFDELCHGMLIIKLSLLCIKSIFIFKKYFFTFEYLLLV